MEEPLTHGMHDQMNKILSSFGSSFNAGQKPRLACVIVFFSFFEESRKNIPHAFFSLFTFSLSSLCRSCPSSALEPEGKNSKVI